MKIGINGLGRIGRSILRQSLNNEDINICIINDLNPDINNISYTINYDTIYGPLKNKVLVSDNKILLPNGKKVEVHSKNSKKKSLGRIVMLITS